MKQSRRNAVNPSGENEHNYDWDLNDPEFQRKLKNYFLHGVSASDVRGHSINVQARFTPVQANIFEEIRTKVAKNLWRTQSDMVRSLISLGCFVALKILSEKNPSCPLESYFKILDLLNMVEKNKNEADLYSQVQKCIYEMNTSRNDMDDKVGELKNVLTKKGKL